MSSFKPSTAGALAAVIAAGLFASSAAADDRRYYFVQNVQGLSEPPPEELYPFTSHTFTNCGQTGRTGPSASACRSRYSPDWVGDAEYFSVSGGIQQWVVPRDGTYRIQAAGAEGGNNRDYGGGRGAVVSVTKELAAGEVIRLLVGQKGMDRRGLSSSSNCNTGGGGGTFVWKADEETLLVAAGAGGGAGHRRSGVDASLGESGTAGNSSTSSRRTGSPGSDGHGGDAGAAGWLSNGSGRTADSSRTSGTPRSPLNNGAGAEAGTNSTGWGGFGGGGGGSGRSCSHQGAGGGGGYSGGASHYGDNSGGGGGGSFTHPDGVRATYSYNTGHGYVTIERL